MTPCFFTWSNDIQAWYCECGSVVHLPQHFSSPIIGYGNHTSERTPGLGDYTESLLQSVGITKERYVAAKEMFGLAPTCNCDSRKDYLNRVSDWWRRQNGTDSPPPP